MMDDCDLFSLRPSQSMEKMHHKPVDIIYGHLFSKKLQSAKAHSTGYFDKTFHPRGKYLQSAGNQVNAGAKHSENLLLFCEARQFTDVQYFTEQHFLRGILDEWLLFSSYPLLHRYSSF